MPGARVLAVLAAALTIYAQPSPTFKIAGRVVRDSDNSAVKGARVSIAAVEHPERQVSSLTDQNGGFFFTGVPRGKYSLQATHRGWSQSFQESDEYSTAIAVGTGTDSEHILFALDTPASISGSVLDEEGDPVGGATVYLFTQSVIRGMSRTRTNAQTITGTGGSFHFSHLAPGTYYAAVVGRPWYAQNPALEQSDSQGVQSVISPELDVAFPLTYYGGGTTPESAAPLKLEEGTKAEIQFTLHAAPALHIQLDGIEKPDGQQLQSSLFQIGPGGIPIAIPAMSTGSELFGVAPGSYMLSASLSGPERPSPIGSQTLGLTGNTTVHLNEAVKTSAGGKVILDGDIPQGLAVVMLNLKTGNTVHDFVKHDGSFDISPVPAGSYSLLLANTSEFYLQKVTATGAPYSNGELEVAKGAQVALTMTAARGLTKINGTVVKRGKPVAGAMVLLLPRDSGRGKFIPRDQSDSDGTFTLNWAPPGRYTLLAIDNGRGLPYADPAVMVPYLPGGRVIDMPVPENAKIEVELQPRR